MKPARLLALIATCALLPSCKKAVSFAASLAKETTASQKETAGTASAAARHHDGPVVTEVPADALSTFQDQPGRVVIIDFYADWCGPCRALSPVLSQIANENNGAVLVGKVDVDKHKSFARSSGVRGIPDVRIYRDGKLVDKFVGHPGAADVRRRIEAQTAQLPAPAPEAAAPAATPAEPTTQPLTKDWLPAGMERR